MAAGGSLGAIWKLSTLELKTIINDPNIKSLALGTDCTTIATSNK